MRKLAAIILLLFAAYCSYAQKKPLDHSVYNSWQHIGERMISNDGKWVVYTIDLQEGDNELVIQSAAADATYRKTVPRGYSASITEDSRYVIFKIKPLYKDIREAKIKKKKADEMPKDSLAIVELGKEEVWKKELVKNYKTPQKSFGWVAYQLEKQPEAGKPKSTDAKAGSRITDSLNRIIDSLQRIVQSAPQKKKKKGKDYDEREEAINYSPSSIYPEDADGDDAGSTAAEPANDLVLRELTTGNEVIFYKVVEYYFSKTGDKLLMEQARNSLDSASLRQVQLYDLKSGKWTILSKGGNDYKGFAINDDGSQVAYVAERDAKPNDPVKYYKLWYYKTGMDSAEMIVDKNAAGMRLGMTVSEFSNVSFSKTGKRLFFGTAPVPVPKDTTIIEIDMPKVDIWHYNDDYLQTVQTFPARLKAAQQENFLAVYHPDTKTIKQLGSREIPQILQTSEGDGDTFVGVSDFGKRVASQWQGSTRKDIYAIDVNTGQKKLIKENLHGQVYPSSTGKYIMWYDRKARNYFVWDGNSTKNISEKIKFPLYQEDWDTPDEPANYGVMGWLKEDVAVFVYDKYDIWGLDPSQENNPQIFTKTLGRNNKTAYRYIQLDPEKRYFDYNDVVLLNSFNQVNKASGFAFMGMDPARFFPGKIPGQNNFLISGVVGQNKKADKIIYSRENFSSSPDLYAMTFFSRDEEQVLEREGNYFLIKDVKLSSINSQQKDYLWGTAELFKWKAYNGKEATGIVYKPENFDPKKKYPMVVYFYEKLSDGLYDYKEPAPIRSSINVPYFVSNGYIIFMPDIEYKIGYPGQSAYDYVVSGARALVKNGWVDSSSIGIQGHSWGGYQAAQLATMTKLFKAVWAGAPVANMTSAYGGIRWESGVNRQFQYEKTQSRIGATLWEKPDLYIKNSPLFHLDKVTAPVVIMANDADGAVPWYQGIELFTALRRLGKKVWMFNYNGQGHGLTQRQDMRDYHIRMQQFFDFMLKGAKPARWITEGVPAIKKGKDWGLETD